MCELSATQMIYMKCQVLFSLKNNKINFGMSSSKNLLSTSRANRLAYTFFSTALFNMLGEIFGRHSKILFCIIIFFRKTGFDISCKLSPNLYEMSDPILGKKTKNIISLLSAEFAQRVVNVNVFVIQNQ